MHGVRRCAETGGVYTNTTTRASGVRPPTGFKLANTVRVPCLRRRADYLANGNRKGKLK